MVATTISLSLWGALWLPSRPPSYCPATRFTRQPAYEAARLILGEEQGYRLAESSGMDIEDAITIATRLLKGRIAKQVWRDYHKHAFARRCYADPSDMGLKALQLSDRRREQDQTEREQLQLQHTLLTRLHHGWRRGIG